MRITIVSQQAYKTLGLAQSTTTKSTKLHPMESPQANIARS